MWRALEDSRSIRSTEALGSARRCQAHAKGIVRTASFLKLFRLAFDSTCSSLPVLAR